MPVKMSTAFSNPAVHVCQPGWHGVHRLAALSINRRVLAPRFPLRQVRCSMKEKCCVSGRDKGKMERRAGPFLLRGTEQTRRLHNPTTVEMLYLAHRVTARWQSPRPAHIHSHPTALVAHTSSTDGGQPIEGNRKEQGHSLLFHPRNCQASTPPQLATDPFLPCRFASHTAVSMFGTKVWWVEGEKVGVAWDLYSAVPKPAKLKRL